MFPTPPAPEFTWATVREIAPSDAALLSIAPASVLLGAVGLAFVLKRGRPWWAWAACLIPTAVGLIEMVSVVRMLATGYRPSLFLDVWAGMAPAFAPVALGLLGTAGLASLMVCAHVQKSVARIGDCGRWTCGGA